MQTSTVLLGKIIIESPIIMDQKKKKTQADKAQKLQIGPLWPVVHSTYNYSAVIFIFIYRFSAPTRQGERKRKHKRGRI